MRQIDELTAILAREGAESLGWEGGRPGSTLARALLGPAARRMAREFALLDEVLAARKLPEAARWALDHFGASVETAGLERVQRHGPILLVANHPGLTDAVALIAALDRDDVRIVAADYPFLHAMRGLASRLIFLGANGTSPLSWIRAATRHLRHGGVVLLFPAGRLEPDPAVPGLKDALLRWSESVALIARIAPDAQVVPAAVSGVLSERAFSHPLTRIRRASRDRQRVATLLQMIRSDYRPVTVRLAFGAAIDAPRSRVSAVLMTELAMRMRDLIIEAASGWVALPRRSVDPVTTTAA